MFFRSRPSNFFYHMTLSLLTAPLKFPVTLEEVKIYLRLDEESDEDSLLQILIAAATEQAESFTQRRFITQTWILSFDEFCEVEIILPYPPAATVNSIKYFDTAGNFTTLAESVDWVVDISANPARIRTAPLGAWPPVQVDKQNAVEIEFSCGYGDEPSDVPAGIRSAILLLISHLYENRAEVITGTIVSNIPKASEWLLYPFRDLRL